jgi:dihydrofolate reductase
MTRTRQIMMFNRVSADGYFAGPDGDLDWVIPDEQVDQEGAAAVPETDTVLFGRKTYQMFERFWPHVLDDSPTAPDPHMPKRRSPELRAFATMLNQATKLVFSRTLKEVTWSNSRLFHDFDPSAIEAMKSQPGKGMIIFGSGTIVSLLTQHGLIDEYHFVVSPILLGKGRTLLNDMPGSAKLKLVETKGYPSGNVRLRYARGS